MSTATAPPTPLDRPDHLVERSVQFPLMVLVASTLAGRRRSRWVFWVVLGIGIVDATYQSYRSALGDWGD
ncbi:hypothetical protein [Curtobacterium sp. 260]|uniref:hypothetical protein n=1 Tax=Curtobacterium sp. 260 TaxID=2817748 RepID=UPI002788D180|nr:hypothetical protein [Curtobacterium sp. 260]MDP9735067.1 putative membrane protein YdbT with pleckstrin-like domain [Curtobacterium sp. 260]